MISTLIELYALSGTVQAKDNMTGQVRYFKIFHLVGAPNPISAWILDQLDWHLNSIATGSGAGGETMQIDRKAATTNCRSIAVIRNFAVNPPYVLLYRLMGALKVYKGLLPEGEN
jgi:hypothetical protein